MELSVNLEGGLANMITLDVGSSEPENIGNNKTGGRKRQT